MTLHWAIAALIITNVCLGLFGAYVPDDWLSDTQARLVVDTHKSIGITVLFLALLRILWRWTHRPPPLPNAFPAWERIAAHAAHGALYVLMLALPLTGWIHDSAWSGAATHPMYLFGLVPWPRIGYLMSLPPAVRDRLHDQWYAIHTWCGYALYVVLLLHVAGALKHEWIDRKSVLRRMWP